MYIINVRGLWIDVRPEEFAGEVAQEVMMCCVDRDRGRQLQNVRHRSVGTQTSPPNQEFGDNLFITHLGERSGLSDGT